MKIDQKIANHDIRYMQKAILISIIFWILSGTTFSQVNINKTVDKSTATAGQNLKFDVSVDYPGEQILSNVRVLDPVPTGTTYLGGSANAGGSNGAYTPLTGENGVDTEGGPSENVTLQTSLTPAVNFINTGNSVTLTLNVKSSVAVINVSPADFEVEGGSYTILSGPAPAAQNVPAGATGVNFTWTIRLDQPGEYIFSSGASNQDVTYVWPSATSSSVLSALQGGPGVVLWSLGSNTSALNKETIISGAPAGVYGLSGNNTSNFARYGITSNTWISRANYGDLINAGGALTTDGGSVIFALRGGGTQAFKKYNTVTDQWTALANTGTAVNAGGALVFLAISGINYVYAFMGNGTGFRRYNISSNTWEARANALGNVKWGGALTTDGTYIYGLRGDNQKSFWGYNPASNSWTSFAQITAAVKAGGALSYLKVNGIDYIYALRGNHKNEFYRYNLSTDTWSRMANTPARVKEGGALTNDGTYLYVFGGKNSSSFWRYNPANNTWQTLPNYYNNQIVNSGGALVYVPQADVNFLLNKIITSHSLITNGSNLIVTMHLTAFDAINNITPGSMTVTGFNGASASFVSGPVFISADDDISGQNDEVIYQWVYTANAGSIPGSLSFSAGATGSGSINFGSALSMSVLVTPVLSFQATVNSYNENLPLDIYNTAIINEFNGAFSNVASNTTVTNIPCRLVVEALKTDISCFGVNNGSISLTITGAAGPVTISWSGPNGYTSSAQNISNLIYGTYTVTVTDARGCIVTKEFTIENVCLTIIKNLVSVNGDTGVTDFSAVGDVLAYEIILTNTGTVTLTNIVVTDLLPGVTVSGSPVASLSANASINVSASYTVNQSDLNNEEVVNNARATFAYNGENYSCEDSETVRSGLADLRIVKTAETSPVVAGGELIYKIVVTNDGPALAHNVVIYDNITAFPDPLYSLNGIDYSSSWTGSYVLPSALALNAGFTIYIKGTISINQCVAVTNAATVESDKDNYFENNNSGVITTTVDDITPPELTCPDDILLTSGNAQCTAFATIINPAATDNCTTEGNFILTGIRSDALDLNESYPVGVTFISWKAEDESGNFSEICEQKVIVYPCANDDYYETLFNTQIIDDVSANDLFITGSAFIIISDPLNGSVVLNEDGTFTYTPNTGFYGNDSFIYEVCLPEPYGDKCDAATANIFIQFPAIELFKSGVWNDPNNDGFAQTGETITYSFTLTNTGNVAVTGLMINDPRIGVTNLGLSPTTLAPGASGTVTFVYTVTQDDIDNGGVYNIAVTTSKDPNGNDVEDESEDLIPLDPDDPKFDPDCPDCTYTGLPQNQGIQIVKTSTTNPNRYSYVGDILAYNLIVTNTGNVTLINVVVDDPVATVTGSPIASLAPGASVTLTLSYNVTQAELNNGRFINTATATGNYTDENGQPQSVSDEDIETVFAQIPDVTPVITAIPNLMQGLTEFNLTVRVTELNFIATKGLIIVKIPKDAKLSFKDPYNPALTILGTMPLNNNEWTFSEDMSHYIFSYTKIMLAGSFSTFGFVAIFDPGNTKGVYTLTSQISSGSGGETRIDNNIESEKLNYFN